MITKCPQSLSGIGNRWLAYPQNSSQFPAREIGCSDGGHDFGRQFIRLPRPTPTSGESIHYVFPGSSEDEMLRVATGWKVTRMPNYGLRIFLSFYNWTIRKFVSKNMSQLGFSVNPETTIPPGLLACCIRPTIVWSPLLQFGSKAFNRVYPFFLRDSKARAPLRTILCSRLVEPRNHMFGPTIFANNHYLAIHRNPLLLDKSIIAGGDK